jgi:hypothetical protein
MKDKSREKGKEGVYAYEREDGHRYRKRLMVKISRNSSPNRAD